ncbi:AAA family ATPase [Streptomyces sp. NPDC054784]
MLIWINGPFGGGKTHTACELRRRLPGSVVSDPEQLGMGLHRMLPPHARDDFQEYAAWRHGVREMLDVALRRHRHGPVIVPMTVVDPVCFADTVGRLRADGHDVRHVALLAERETVHRRLRGRGLAGLRDEGWARERVDRCLEALARPEFAEHVVTDGLSVREVAETVAESAGLGLAPSGDGRVRRGLRRAQVTLRHVRLG